MREDDRLADDFLVKTVLEKELKERKSPEKKLYLDNHLNLHEGLGSGAIKMVYDHGDFKKQPNGPIIAYVRYGRLMESQSGRIIADLNRHGECDFRSPQTENTLIDYLINASSPY